VSIAQNFNLNSNQYKTGDVYIPNPKIIFDFARWTIKTESYPQLDSIARFLLKNDGLIIEVGTHTDSRGRGSDMYCTRLDTKRSESIVKFLISKGINRVRLVARGYGKTQLIISDEEIDEMKTDFEREEAHAVNRRTEFKIIEIK